AIAVKGDRLAEPDETFSVQLTTSNNTVAIDRSVAQGTILDNEPRVSIDDPGLLEGDSGTATMTFNVTLQAPYDVPVTIQYATADGTATAGSDYAAASGTVTFAPGETLQTIAIAVNGDRLLEDDETILVNITTPDSSAAIVKGQGI